MGRCLEGKQVQKYVVRFRRGVLLHRLQLLRYDDDGTWNGFTACEKQVCGRELLLLAKKPRGIHYNGRKVDYRKKCRKCEVAFRMQARRKPRHTAATTEVGDVRQGVQDRSARKRGR